MAYCYEDMGQGASRRAVRVAVVLSHGGRPHGLAGCAMPQGWEGGGWAAGYASAGSAAAVPAGGWRGACLGGNKPDVPAIGG
jgi:hypothetical protein